MNFYPWCAPFFLYSDQGYHMQAGIGEIPNEIPAEMNPNSGDRPDLTLVQSTGDDLAENDLPDDQPVDVVDRFQRFAEERRFDPLMETSARRSALSFEITAFLEQDVRLYLTYLVQRQAEIVARTSIHVQRPPRSLLPQAAVDHELQQIIEENRIRARSDADINLRQQARQAQIKASQRYEAVFPEVRGAKALHVWAYGHEDPSGDRAASGAIEDVQVAYARVLEKIRRSRESQQRYQGR